MAVLLIGCKNQESNQAIINQKPTIQKSVIMNNIVENDVGIDDQLTFVKTYTVELKNGNILTIETELTPYTYLYENGIKFDEKITQTDGATVWFDCGRIADKILNYSLVPEIQKNCSLIHTIANDFWKKNTSIDKFVDEDGYQWIRAGKVTAK